MMLRLVRLEDATPKIVWRIESPVPGVVLIDVDVGSREPVPLHWRAGTWTKPPLDVFLDSEGHLAGFQLVLQDERVALSKGSNAPLLESGLPVFDTTLWPADRYLDEHMKVSTVRLSTGELVVGIGEDDRVMKVYQVGTGLTIGLVRDVLVEIRLGPLTVDDWDSINAFSSVR
jgi:hypothetical protein